MSFCKAVSGQTLLLRSQRNLYEKTLVFTTLEIGQLQISCQGATGLGIIMG